MAKVIRFGVSLDKDLSKKFDAHIRAKKYRNRSEALRDLIREELVRTEWLKGGEVAGTVTLVYNHHKRELINKLTDIQHDFHSLIVSSQHVHLDHDNCLEIIVAKGKPEDIKNLSCRLQATKGVKFAALTAATTGKSLT